MSKKKRTFSKEEKLSIFKEASEQGLKVTLDKHGLFPATFYSWKKKFEQMGEDVYIKQKSHSFTCYGLCDSTGTRTPNLLLRRQLLYPVELWNLLNASFPIRRCKSTYFLLFSKSKDYKTM
jgi:transposase-like protein